MRAIGAAQEIPAAPSDMRRNGGRTATARGNPSNVEGVGREAGYFTLMYRPVGQLSLMQANGL